MALILTSRAWPSLGRWTGSGGVTAAWLHLTMVRRKEFKSKSDHNGSKGDTGMYVVKAVTDKMGKLDKKGLAQAIKSSCFSAEQTPGLLMDVCFDDEGDIDRLVEVKGGKQVVVETLLPPGKK